VESEEVTVTAAVFNKPIDASRFTLAALELPENTLIIHRPLAFAEEKDLAAIESAGRSVPNDSPFTKWSANSESSLSKEDIEARRKKIPLATRAAPTHPVAAFVWFNLIGVGGAFVWYGISQRFRQKN
jgi:hypothetical protein